MRTRANNYTRVRSCEDVLDGRDERIELVVNRNCTDPTVIEMDVRVARAIARALVRHANFLDPKKPRARR